MRDLKSQLVWCRRGQWALSIALVAACTLIYALAIRPALLRSQVVRVRVAAQQARLDVARARVASLSDVERETEEVRLRVERADKQLLHQTDLPAVIGEVTKYGRDSSLRDIQWRADARPVRTQQFTELPVDFTFAGEFTNIFDFLRHTEDMQRLTRVKKLTIHSLTDPDSTAQVDGQLTMNLYFMEE